MPIIVYSTAMPINFFNFPSEIRNKIYPRWMRLFGPLTTSDLGAHPNNRASVRLAIGDGDQVAAEEQYHDEIDDGQQEIAAAEYANGNSSRSRVKPSGLVTSGGGELWGEEA
jgi:hypothetical protein